MHIRNIAFASAFALVAAAAAQDEEGVPTGHFFRTVYDLYSRQMMVKDITGLTASMRRNLSPDFVFIDAKNERLSGPQLLALIKGQLGVAQDFSQATITPHMVWKSNGMTNVLTTSIVKFSFAGDDGKTHAVSATSTTLDSWVFDGNRYELVKEQTLSEKAWRDRILVGSSSFENWQQMIPKYVPPAPAKPLLGRDPLSMAVAPVASNRISIAELRGPIGGVRSAGKYDAEIRQLQHEVRRIERTLAAKPWAHTNSVRKTRKKRHHSVKHLHARSKTLSGTGLTGRRLAVARQRKHEPLKNQSASLRNSTDEMTQADGTQPKRNPARVLRNGGGVVILSPNAKHSTTSSTTPGNTRKPDESVSPGQ